MPFTRISLRRGKPQEYIRALSDRLHQALVEEFEVPAADRFQVFHQLSADDLVFDRDYLCGPRSDDFLLIAITAGRVRDTNTKKSFYRRLVELLEIDPGIRSEDVMVVINTTESDEWSFGNGLATMVIDRENQ
jgi:phenylpyruvate tautomerase PptA (4-oxalocrotonate tautomerase family)